MGQKATVTFKPWCPFCGQDVERPQEPEQRKMAEFLMGRCQCGAVYACDQTGHNVGAAMVDCLEEACGDWDLAWELVPDEDYLTSRVENYDLISHQIVDTRNLDGRAVGGVLYFIRLNKDISELTSSLAGNKKKQKSTSICPIPIEPKRNPNRLRQKATKKMVKDMADQGDIDGLVDLTFDDSRVIRYLQRLLYEPSIEKRWMYAHIIGQVSARYSTQKPGAISDLLHRLFEACSDSAATHWGLIESIGSIIAARPDIYGAFARHILMHRNVPSVRAEVLWAMGAIAKVRPDIVRATPIYSVFPLIDHPEPATRGHAILLLGRIKATEVQSKLDDLVSDMTIITIYEDGKPYQKTIGDLAKEAVAQITATN